MEIKYALGISHPSYFSKPATLKVPKSQGWQLLSKELWHSVRASMRSSQLPPSEKYSRAKGTALNGVEALPVACILPQDRDLLPSRTLSLWLGRGKALPAVISNIRWPLLWCLPSGNSQFPLCVLFSPCCCTSSYSLWGSCYAVCLSMCIEGKGHCSFCVKNPDLPCWITPPSPCPLLLAASHWRTIHWKSAAIMALGTQCKCT